MSATMEDIPSHGLGHEPPMPALYDLRTALADHHLEASIVFRNGQPHLLIGEASMLVRLDSNHFTWRPASPSAPADWAGQHAADDIDTAAAALSTAITDALVRRLTTRATPEELDTGAPDDQGFPLAVRDSATASADGSTSPAHDASAEFEHACEALRCGTLQIHELSLDMATDAERASPALAGGEALAKALNSRFDDSATAIPINRWVTAIGVCRNLIALTDSTRFVWLPPIGPEEPAKLRATQALPNAVRLLSRERAQITAPRAPSAPT
ncbi:hypothetical protein GCM10009733_006500 [Nonomuraea maheshkhaliensis]|uniref:DUF2470 domain-containing protein n=1 Tax=Nonomuraea maheshkhaliensis TaxID=419590 RepID=A0ABP4QKS4_9ACTN